MKQEKFSEGDIVKSIGGLFTKGIVEKVKPLKKNLQLLTIRWKRYKGKRINFVQIRNSSIVKKSKSK